MSSFAHIKQDPVFNSVVKTTVPPRWDALLNEKLPSTVDTSLEGITRTVYERPDPKFPLNGEIWKASGVAGDPSPALTFKVTGHLQMYVVSGAGEITKNGAPINLRPGEKVAFNTDDTFSIDRNSALTLFVRNEKATFKVEAEASTMKLSAIRMPSAHEVALTRAMLGIEPEPTERRWPERKVPSSRGYARSKAG